MFTLPADNKPCFSKLKRLEGPYSNYECITSNMKSAQKTSNLNNSSSILIDRISHKLSPNEHSLHPASKIYTLQNINSLSSENINNQYKTGDLNIKKTFKSTCKCINSECLSKHCLCFKRERICQDCLCKNCLNTPQNHIKGLPLVNQESEQISEVFVENKVNNGKIDHVTIIKKLNDDEWEKKCRFSTEKSRILKIDEFNSFWNIKKKIKV